MMKHIGSLVLLLMVSISFSQPATTDPYFVESPDTVSTWGPACITRHIHEDKKGNIWLASWQGIMKYDGKVFTNYTLKENLIHFHVYSIMEDRSGNIWFGTVRGGAYKYDGKTFTLYTSNDGLANDLIGCLMEDKTGKIWFGTDGGLSRFDTSALFRTNARLGVTTLSGLALKSKKGFTNYTTDNGLCDDRVNSMIQDKTGKIWIATRSGVSCYDPSASVSAGAKPFSDFKIKQGVPFTNVRCIKEDKNGKIWIGGQEGLYCYDPSATNESSLIQIMPNFICYIFEDKAGNLWISTGTWGGPNGMALYKYPLAEIKTGSKSLSMIIEKNKRGDEQIFEITEDKSGNIWFSTMRGPCRYNPNGLFSADGKAFTYFTR